MTKNWQPFKTTRFHQTPTLQMSKFIVDNLILTLEFDNALIEVLFDSPFSYRMIGESYAFKTLKKMNFTGDNWLYRSASTEFTQWFDSESESVYQEAYIDYMIITHDYIIEVLTRTEPSIKQID